MIAEVFVAEHEAEQALGEQVREGMLAATGIAVIGEAGGQAPGQADALVDGPQQEGSAIGGHAAAVKAGANLAAALLGEVDCDTVCGHGVCLLVARKLLITNMLPRIHTSCHPPW